MFRKVDNPSTQNGPRSSAGEEPDDLRLAFQHLFAVVEAEPVPERLRQLALALTDLLSGRGDTSDPSSDLDGNRS